MLVADCGALPNSSLTASKESRMTSKKQIAPRTIGQDNDAPAGRRPTVLASGDIARFIEKFDLQNYASYSSEWLDGRAVPANEGSAATDASGGADTAVRRIEPATTTAAHRPRRWPAALAGFFAWAWQAYRREREIARAVAYLSTLNDHTLRDIGLHRSEIEEAVRHGRL
jgi:uncharacterized protein YjiS (DUF1127 family)